MRKLISRTLISAKINLVKIWKKKNFVILIFVLSFFYRGFMQFYDLPENAMVYIVCSYCPKIACCAKISLWRKWDTNIEKTIILAWH